jgi:Pvc16 N-terminal domain
MSDYRAIAGVTDTLVSLIRAATLSTASDAAADLSAATILAVPLDLAQAKQEGDPSKPLVNLFLYQVEHSGAWQNLPMPGQVRPNEQAFPPLALTLYYLLTAYGGNDEETYRLGEQVLGLAMRALHDKPILQRNDFQTTSTVATQVERLKITRQPLNIDEMSKLWSSFQAKYRISTAYRVDVVLIESLRSATAALPVLTRSGREDRGVIATGSLVPPFTTLSQLVLPPHRNGIRVGEVMTFTGHALNQGFSFKETDLLQERRFDLRFRNLLLDPPLDVRIAQEHFREISEDRIAVELPEESPQGAWVPGAYSAALEITEIREFNGERYHEVHTSNELFVGIVPVLGIADPTVDIVAEAADIKLTCSPPVRKTQRVSLFLNSREIRMEPSTALDPLVELTFKVSPAFAGTYRVRLRVDGVDSELITVNDRGQPAFDATQQIVLVDSA